MDERVPRWWISRRSLGYFGVACLGGIVAAPPWSPKKAGAAIITSWDFPQNENLDTRAVAERFERINGSYAIGEAFSAEDADFILRYAKPFVSGGDRQASSRGGDGVQCCEVSAVASDAYVGNFVYRCSSVVQAGCPDAVCQDIRIGERRMVYGLTHPFGGGSGGGSIGIIDCFEQTYSQETEDWFTAEFVDEFTGVAVGLYAYCHASITLANGEVFELRLEL